MPSRSRTRGRGRSRPRTAARGRAKAGCRTRRTTTTTVAVVGVFDGLLREGPTPERVRAAVPSLLLLVDSAVVRGVLTYAQLFTLQAGTYQSAA